MQFHPHNYATEDAWNEHWYQRCWQVIEKYDPDMFNHDSPYKKIGGLTVSLSLRFIIKKCPRNEAWTLKRNLEQMRTIDGDVP